MFKEFREFISKGNVIDLAVGIIIGAAFTAIVSSLVKDILTPLLSLFGNKNLESQFWVLKAGDKAPPPYADYATAQKAGAVTLGYGSFLSAVINFLLVAIVLFVIVKAINKFRKQEAAAPAAPPEPTKEEVLLTEIRDLLAKKA